MVHHTLSQEEPLTYHRRGHWFEPSIAHHSIGSRTGRVKYAPQLTHTCLEKIQPLTITHGAFALRQQLFPSAYKAPGK
jgi:hypothetical protein